MRPTASQENLQIRLTTPLDADLLIPVHVEVSEAISEPFVITLHLVSTDAEIVVDDIVGEGVTLELHGEAGLARHFHGMVTRFVQAETTNDFTRYFAEVRPWLWRLHDASDSRIFQSQTVPAIIEAVFGDLGFTDFTNSLTATYPQREYCVQYQETAFDFVSRLMEEEGISYFFEHEEDRHVLILADDADGFPTVAGTATATLRPSETGRDREGELVSCEVEHRIGATKVILADYDFTVPATDLEVALGGDESPLERYAYPGNYEDRDGGERLVKLRLEESESLLEMLRGRGFARNFVAGHRFTLAGHPRTDANVEYTLSRVRHVISPRRYENEFEAFPATVAYRPPRKTPRPVVAGSQTAVVVGKEGEEIWTDSHGRVKVQFHWDRVGANDETSSCWIRVAQVWAGKAWGTIFIPRIGAEVVVSFLEGNPDRPLVTGTVYNGVQTVPYGLPDGGTRSGILTNVSKDGGGGNELRFEDLKDSEEIYLHAQKDYNMVVLNDATIEVQNARTTTIKEGDDALTVEKGARTVTISEGDLTYEVTQGKLDVTVGSDEDRAVTGNRTVTVDGNESLENGGTFKHESGGNYTLKVTGNLVIEATGTVSIKAGTSLTAKAGTALTNEAGTALTNKAGTSLTNEAAIGITAKANATHKVESSGIVEVKGSLVKIN